MLHALIEIVIIVLIITAFVVFLLMHVNRKYTGSHERKPAYTDPLANLARQMGITGSRSAIALAIATAAQTPEAVDELVEAFTQFVRGTTSTDTVAALDKDNKWWVKITRGQDQIDHLESITKQCCAVAYEKIKRRVGPTNHRGLALAVAAGIKIYSDKPNIGADTTWTADEYNMPEFQLVYLRIKALQRYTENYTLAELAGVRPRKIVSIGGGCGFEITAMSDYLAQSGNSLSSVTIIDIVDTWRDYCPITCGENVKFITSDINSPSAEALDAIADADTIIFSYVFRYLKRGFFDEKFAGKNLLFNERNQPVADVVFAGGARAKRLSPSLYVVTSAATTPSRYRTFSDV